jgi:hypothetical protein
MATVSYEETNLMLQLYELRSEPRLRTARIWFMESFCLADSGDKTKWFSRGTAEYANIQMVISYWEMASAIVNRGLIDDEFFFENNGEAWIVWERIREIMPKWRSSLRNPALGRNLEEWCGRLEAWRERRAQGSSSVLRQMIQKSRSNAI